MRNIEQNELALAVEGRNTAILVFTFVTIIFLPLSFFTSYFGMNLRELSEDDRTEGYFWAICGCITVLIVSGTAVFGFKDRLYKALWTDRVAAKLKAKSKVD